MPHIPVIDLADATGELKEIYEELIQSRGKLAEVHKIQSLNPRSIVNHMDLYLTIMFGRSPLKRVQREMMAVVVSRANQCPYCQVHHAEAVQHYWKDAARVEALRKDFRSVELKEQDRLLCAYAEKLTLEPAAETQQQFFEPLRNTGLSDRGILDATLVISYFNFVNRMVLGLGVVLEENPGGYAYD